MVSLKSKWGDRGMSYPGHCLWPPQMPPGPLWDDLGPRWFLDQRWLCCELGTDSTADPCCSLQSYRRAWAEPSRLCLSRGKYLQKVICPPSQHHKAVHRRDGKKDRLWVNYQPQDIFLCPITGTTFSLHCPVRIALASLLCPRKVFVPRRILRASRIFVLFSLLCLSICC